MSTEEWLIWELEIILLWLAVDNFAVNFIPDIDITGKLIIYTLLAIFWVAISNVAFRD